MKSYDAGLCRAITATLLVGSVFADPGTAIAQDQMEEIVVTGSRIPRRDFVALSPTTTIDNLELRLSGTTNLEDALNRLPQVVPDFGRSSNNPGDGTANVNLRGLGANRSLILLNGRRMIPTNPFGNVDINNIPAGLIERVEVVSGGASAVYGSDALTGAVNFITRGSYDGIGIGAQYDITEQGDGQVINLDITAGTPFANGRGQLTGFINVNDRESVFQGDREFSAETITYDFVFGNIMPGGSRNTPAGTTPRPFLLNGVAYTGRDDRVVYLSDGTPDLFVQEDDVYDFGPINYLQVPLRRYTASILADLDVGNSSNVYTEIMYVLNEGAQELAPTLLPSFAMDVTVDNPLYPQALQQFLRESYDEDPFGLDPFGTVDGVARIPIGKRFEEVGPRRTETESDMIRIVAGIRGEFANEWEWDAYYIHAETSQDESQFNDVSLSRLRQSLLVDPATGQCTDPSNGCAPANLFGAGNLSQEAVDFLRVPPLLNYTENTQDIAHVSVVGDLMELPAGSLGFAVGIEWREESATFTPDPALFTGDLLGWSVQDPIDGSTTLTEIFGELRVPLLADLPLARYLGLELGYRYSDHSISDTFDSWKVSGEWEFATGYRVRASLQQAVRAPNIAEFFVTGSEGFTSGIANFGDLCSANLNGVPNLDVQQYSDVCIAQGIPASEFGTWVSTPNYEAQTLFRGNPLLEPEESETLTAGIVIQPPQLDNLSISVDYYDIQIDNAITGIGGAGIVGLCFTINDPNDPVCQNVQRNDGLTYNVSVVRGGPYNIAKIATSGVDLQINYVAELPNWAAISAEGATLSLWIVANKLLESLTQNTPDVEGQDCAGFFGFPCDNNSFGTLPEYRASTRLSYDTGPLTLSLQWQWLDGIEDAWPAYGLELFGIPPEIHEAELPNIGSYSYFNLSGDYQINDVWSVYGGVQNLGDREPPLMAGNSVAANSDPSTYDLMGRRYFLGLTLAF